jgi:hypothetical protein
MANSLEIKIYDYMDDPISFILDNDQIEEFDRFIVEVNGSRVCITREDWHKIVSFVNDNF